MPTFRAQSLPGGTPTEEFEKTARCKDFWQTHLTAEAMAGHSGFAFCRCGRRLRTKYTTRLASSARLVNVEDDLG